MTFIAGALLGILGVRFRWRGLIALVVLSLVLPIISTSLYLQFGWLSPDAQIDMHPANIAGVSAFQFVELSFWSAVFSGVHWLVTRRKRAA
jgi:hypothetical protein